VVGDRQFDVSSPHEVAGERTLVPDYPPVGTVRGGHIPTARSVPWGSAAAEDGRFRSPAELEEIYQSELGFDTATPTIVYCRIGERSAHSWFVLNHLLGFEDVRNYDGSWPE